MVKNFPDSGKRTRSKTATKGKRYLCARCRKRSPKPVKTPAPWYCPTCLRKQEQTFIPNRRQNRNRENSI